MDIYDSHYFRVNKYFLMKGGLWPYEKNHAKKLFSRLYVGISIFVLTLPQFYGLYKNFGIHMDKVIEHMALLMFMNGIFLKFITSIMAENNLKKVYDSIAENWIDLKDPEERRILASYSNNGVIITVGYLAYMLMAMMFYITLPLTPLLLNFVASSNETRPPDFIFKGEFPVDNMRDHYNEIFVFDTLGCLSTVYVLVTVDGMYASCIEHCTGLFAIIKHRLELCTNNTDIRGEDVAYKLIVEIVKLHVKTIATLISKTHLRRSFPAFVLKHIKRYLYVKTFSNETAYSTHLRLVPQTCRFVNKIFPYRGRYILLQVSYIHFDSFTDLLEESYSMSFLILMGMNMLYCSFVSVLILIKQNEVIELIRYSGILGGLVMHLFYVSWPGQKLIDHSTGLFDDAYNNDWYKISRRSKDLLRFMKLRCLKPCQLTAGGIYVMNLENFAAIIKTSGSYITVFASFT